jgi:four helix bundle protein
MPVRDFRDLTVWQKSVDLAVGVYELTRSFPSSERFGLVKQLRDAAASVSSNIAEGNGRRTTKDYVHFLSTSKGSLNEVRSLLVVSTRLKFASHAQIVGTDDMIQEISKMLSALSASLETRVVRIEKGATSRSR